MDFKVPSAEFVITAVAPEGYPRPDRPEYAFVGRSNVGKSSLINAMCKRNKLVRVSNTPGRTRALNFFDVSAAVGSKLHKVRLCDLPGYGYAKVSKAERADWTRLIEGYVTSREGLRGVVHLVDAEVGPTELDVETLAWLQSIGRPVVSVATKLDRLPKAKRIPALRAHERLLGLPTRALLGASSEEGLGLHEVWFKLFELERAVGAA